MNLETATIIWTNKKTERDYHMDKPLEVVIYSKLERGAPKDAILTGT